ncbi:hypothetical protein ACQCSI_13465, partial [Ralstonia pseudosolanacearum]
MQDNNLVMALLGAGVVFVLVIVVYNQWQIRKARGPQAYQPPADEGVRGLLERNTMRYYLAIDAYLKGLSA